MKSDDILISQLSQGIKPANLLATQLNTIKINLQDRDMSFLECKMTIAIDIVDEMNIKETLQVNNSVTIILPSNYFWISSINIEEIEDKNVLPIEFINSLKKAYTIFQKLQDNNSWICGFLMKKDDRLNECYPAFCQLTANEQLLVSPIINIHNIESQDLNSILLEIYKEDKENCKFFFIREIYSFIYEEKMYIFHDSQHIKKHQNKDLYKIIYMEHSVLTA